MPRTGAWKITRTTMAIDAFRMSPSIRAVFKRYGFYCPTCKGISEETIEKIAVNKGMDPDRFVDELNAALE